MPEELENAIRVRAYYLWEDRCIAYRPGGSALGDWLRAEREERQVREDQVIITAQVRITQERLGRVA